MTIRMLLASFAALSLLAQPGPGPDGGRPMPGRAQARMARAGEQMAFMAHHLKLSETQKARMKEAQQKNRPEIQARQKAARESHEAFRAALQNPDSQTDQLRKLHQAAADRQLEVALAQRSAKLEVRALLTPEQRVESDRMQALGEERRRFRADRMKKAMETRQGPRGMGPGARPGMGRE